MTMGMSEVVLSLAFSAGGGLGAVVRYLFSRMLTHEYPYATLLVNVLGCFFLGFLLALVWDAPGILPREIQHAFVGFCGGFTTFSSFAYQTLDLHRQHSLRHAALNIAASVVLCTVTFLLGRWLGQSLALVNP